MITDTFYLAPAGETPLDISDRVLSFSHSRGRRDASPAVSRYGGGAMRLRLRNEDGELSPRNTGSAYYPFLKRGSALVRFADYGSGAESRWAGYVTRVHPVSAGLPYVEVEAKTALSFIEGRRVRAAGVLAGQTGEVVDHVLDAIAWSAGLRNIATGIGGVKAWFAKTTEYAGAVLHALADTELGFLFDDPDGYIVFEDRHERLSKTSQDVWSDDPADGTPHYNVGIEYIEAESSLVNQAEARFATTVAGASAFLFPVWYYAEPFTLAPGASRELIAELTPVSGEDDDGVPFRRIWVAGWQDPDVETSRPVLGIPATLLHDGAVANEDLAVVITEETATTAKLTVTNNGSEVATIESGELAVSIIVSERGVTLAQSVDQDSIDTYGERPSQAVGRWFDTLFAAQAWTRYLTRRFADPDANYLSAVFEAEHAPSPLYARLISDVVTVRATERYTRFFIDGDFHIESIEESYDAEGDRVHYMRFVLSPVDSQAGDYFAFDDPDALDGTKILLEL